MMNIKQLKAELKNLEIAFPSKAKKAELEALLAAASPSDEPVEAPKKKRTSTKDILRGLFTEVGDELLVEDVVAHVVAAANVKEATIGTMIGDLKNPKYCGPLGPIYIDRRSGKGGDVYARVDAPAS